MKLFVDNQEILFPERAGMSDEEFHAFCIANPSLNLERDASGNILIMAPTGMISGYHESVVNTLLGAWNLKTNAGRTFSSQTGFTLPNGAIRSPDGAWISSDRWNALSDRDREGFGRICPDFVVEIRSRTDRVKDLMMKMDEYMANGCRLGVLLDPANREAWVYRPGSEPSHYIGADAILSGGDVLPGFELPLAVFRD